MVDCEQGECALLGSKSLVAHLARGAIAAVLLTSVFLGLWPHAAFSVAACVGAVIAMRGCPACWTLGLVETIGRVRDRQGSRARDGRLES